MLAGAVDQLRTENPNTVFAAAGDLIGASTFESFIAKDKPTIDALNAAGLEVSAVGQPRVRPGLRRSRQPGDGAVQRDQQPARRGGVGVPRAPTSGTPTTVRRPCRRPGCRTSAASRSASSGRSPTTWTSWCRRRHRGSDGPGSWTRPTARPTSSRRPGPTSSCCWSTRVRRQRLRGRDGSGVGHGSIVNGADENIDAIISGHTHLAYNCRSRCRPGSTGPGGDHPSGGLGRPVRLQPEPADLHRRSRR